MPQGVFVSLQLRHALIRFLGVQCAEVTLREGETLSGGFFIPPLRGFFVFFTTHAGLVKHGEVVLRFGVTLFCRPL